MVRSNLDLYPESWSDITTITTDYRIPRNRLLRVMIEIVLSDSNLIKRSIEQAQIPCYRRK